MKKRLLQINVTANSGSTGRIAEGIGCLACKFGFEAIIAYGRWANQSQSTLIRIGEKWNILEHGLESRLFDNHGLASRLATRKLIDQIAQIHPNLIHLHNIHGYFVNYAILFDYLKKSNIPVVWTLHDCWPFTGHCVYFSTCQCDKWKSMCHDCPQTKTYPASYLLDRSKQNYILKKQCFTSLSNLHIVSVSNWLDCLVGESFLQEQHHLVIHNGIDTDVFSPAEDIYAIRRKVGIAENDTMLLGVASVWSERKGLKDFIKLHGMLRPSQKIVLIGLTKKQINTLPSGIIGIERTESARELADYYSAADLFLNLTYEDNYPTTNLEAISCGTPCLTYQTGGSPESITDSTGYVVEHGDFSCILKIIANIDHAKRAIISNNCREYAITHFRQEDCFDEYIKLYQKLLPI